MSTIKKKQMFIFSDGSILSNKTFIKTSNKIKILKKDPKTFLFYKKDKKNNQYVKNLDHFKLKFFKF